MDWYERTTFWSSAHARNLTPRSLPETRTRSPRFCRRPQFSARSLYYAIQASTFKMDATNNLLSLRTTSLEISHHLSACMYDVAWHIFRASHIGIRYLLWTFGDSLLQINSQKNKSEVMTWPKVVTWLLEGLRIRRDRSKALSRSERTSCVRRVDEPTRSVQDAVRSRNRKLAIVCKSDTSGFESMYMYVLEFLSRP